MQWLTRYKKIRLWLVPLLVVVGVGLFQAQTAHAGIVDWLAGLTLEGTLDGLTGSLAWVLSIIVEFVGGLLAMLVRATSAVFAYNDFGNARAVVIGWTLVRDIANIFFLLIILVIALATILRMESYNLRKLLPKVLIMAVLVNFSKVIAELLVDFAQVIMLQFVNAFHGAFEGQFYNLLNIQGIINAAGETDGLADSAIGLAAVVTSYLLAVVLLFTILVVLLVMLAILLVRMVALWVLILLSPLAFVAAAFPGTEGVAKKWWSEFVKYLAIGPILAFFIWLTLAVGTTDLPDTNIGPNVEPVKIESFVQDIGGADSFTRMLIVLTMLFIGLKMTASAGGMIGNVAGVGFGAARSFGANVGKLYGRRTDDFATNLPARGLRTLGWASRLTGAGLKKVGLEGAGQALTRFGSGSSGIGRSIQDKFRFRGVPAGYRLFRQRVEEEALGDSAKFTADVLNKTANIPGINKILRGTNSREYDGARTRREAEIQKEKSEDYVQSEDQFGGVVQNLTKDGELAADEGSKREAIGFLRLMAADRNLNDFVHDYLAKYGSKVSERLGVKLDTATVKVKTEQISGDDYGALSDEDKEGFEKNKDGSYSRKTAISDDQYAQLSEEEKKQYADEEVGTYTNKNLKNILRYMAGGNEREAGRIGAQLSKLGLASGERQLFGLTTTNKKGQTVLAPDDKEYSAVEFSTSLDEGQSIARNGRAEPLLEQWQSHGKRGYGGFRDFVFEGDGSILERIATAMIEHANRWNAKGARDLLNNKDLLIKQVAESNISDDKKDLFYRGIATLETTFTGKSSKNKVSVSEDTIPIAPESTAGQAGQKLTNSTIPSGGEINHQEIYDILGDRDDKGNVNVGDIKTKIENYISNELGIDVKTTQGQADVEKARRAVISNMMAEVGARSEANSKAIEANTASGKVDDERQLRSDMKMLIRDLKRFEARFAGSNDTEAKKSKEYYDRLDALLKAKENSAERVKNINAVASEITTRINGTWNSIV